MTLSKLQQFQAVCRYHSVTRAAERLHISQPSVSNAIRELESEFGVNLFRHEGRRLVLTAEGRFLLERANILLEKADQVSRQMHDLGRNKNLFRIGVPPMAGTALFPTLYRAFKAQYPQINMSITECGSLQAVRLLEQGELDIAIASVEAPADERFQTLRLRRSQLLFCVSPSHRLAGEKEVSIAALAEEPLVLFGEDSVPSHIVLQKFYQENLRPNVLLYSSQISMIQQFIADGTAGAFLLEDVVRREPGIIPVPLAEPIPMDIILLWKRDQYLYNDVSSFIQFSRNFQFWPEEEG